MVVVEAAEVSNNISSLQCLGGSREVEAGEEAEVAAEVEAEVRTASSLTGGEELALASLRFTSFAPFSPVVARAGMKGLVVLRM